MKNKSNRVNYYFYIIAFFISILYIFFYLSPSSYGIALNIFDVPNKPFIGEARPIRSDEWSIWTPYLQMTVNNNFERFYETPGYLIDLRGFNQLPLLDWMVIFKPLTWGFFLFSPARAFSIYHILVTLFFVFGWKSLIEKTILKGIEYGNVYAMLFSLILYFTGFVQYWLTTLGPILAFTPWLYISLISESKYSAFLTFYIAVVWLVSHTYPPIIIQSVYLGIIFILIHEKNWNLKILILKYWIKAIICILAVFVVFFYFKDVIKVLSETIYPGKRLSLGGDSSWQYWLSSFFPYLLINGYEQAWGPNICEVGGVVTYLPLFSLCFLDYKNSKEIFGNRIFFLLLSVFLFISLWMVVSFPEWFVKITLLYMSPAHRGVYLLGLSLNILSILFIIRGEIRFDLYRISIFSFLIILGYLISGYISGDSLIGKTYWELMLIPVLLVLFIFKKLNKLTLMLTMLFLSLAYTFNFNPLQSTKPIFDIINSSKTEEFNAYKNKDGWVIKADYPGAILSGIGVKSFTNVLIRPQLDFFRSIYPDMYSDKFNYIFNRYSHIQVSPVIKEPFNPHQDTIVIPIKDIQKEKIDHSSSLLENITLSNDINIINTADKGGSLDSISYDGKYLYLKGWVLSPENKILIITPNIKELSLVEATSAVRNDVVSVIKDRELKNSGFNILLENSMKDSRFCLVSYSDKYGYKILPSIKEEPRYGCDF
ncbi:hypothetical protein HYE53_08200 [Aggregatibacter actinomycetemcomitans]|uniref:DUF7657 domain-containing protein n=1 Tax=Aggregatibacter actinomycetemcomitans TaxID=714 RepID=UPI00197B93DC|nr:hypothetical protein [Aggregatibacter actinomycetemcomitans]MBN6071051.1 hypothetical protein [Aggregatibacter actinomycetemcomitans]